MILLNLATSLVSYIAKHIVSNQSYPKRRTAASIALQKYPNLTSASIPNEGCGASFWGRQGFIFELFWVSRRVLAAKCVLGGVFGGSWVGLGRVLGPSWGPGWTQLITPKFPPKPNPIGVLGRLEGSLERPRSVLGAFWERLGAF